MMAALALAICVPHLAACSGDGEESGSTGSVRVTISGEGAAKVGYPYEKNGFEVAFVDGWSVVFDHYMASVGSLQLATFDGEVGFEDPASYVADLRLGDPVVGLYEGIEARRWESFNFSVPHVAADAVALGEVDAELREQMASDGLSYWVEGEATHPQKGAVRFAWGIPTATRNRNCTNGVDNTDGVVVRSNAETSAEITIHVDHMFWDSLGTELASMRFDPIWGADKDKDGQVTTQELSEQRISDLTDQDGEPLLDEEGQPLAYNPGAIPLPDKNLQAFIFASVSSQTHLNGVGLCSVQAQ